MNYRNISTLALASSRRLVESWLPGGVYRGANYTVRNPKRDDHSLGSFSVNIQTGRWADFATNDKGGDLISLYAYLNDIPQREACIALLTLL